MRVRVPVPVPVRVCVPLPPPAPPPALSPPAPLVTFPPLVPTAPPLAALLPPVAAGVPPVVDRLPPVLLRTPPVLETVPPVALAPPDPTAPPVATPTLSPSLLPQAASEMLAVNTPTRVPISKVRMRGISSPTVPGSPPNGSRKPVSAARARARSHWEDAGSGLLLAFFGRRFRLGDARLRALFVTPHLEEAPPCASVSWEPLGSSVGK